MQLRQLHVNSVRTLQSQAVKTRERNTKYNKINWKKAEKHIHKIQLRITKAVKDLKHNLAKRLQHLLANSFYAKAVAVRKVSSQNKGKNTPGIDGITWTNNYDKAKAIDTLNNTKYKAKPLKRIYIDKPGKSTKRKLSIPTMYDRAMQALYQMTLEPIAEMTADKTSFGFRTYRSTHDAMEYTFKVLSQKTSAQWILEGDIKSCFDDINHDWIIKNIPMNKKILTKFIKTGYLEKKTLYPTETGVGQGSPIAPTIANMTLDGIEDEIAKSYWSNKKGTINKKKQNNQRINYIRYCDDFVITANSKEILEEIQNKIEFFLLERGLILSREKTKITHIKEGFDFLGWNFRKYDNNKLIIKPSKSSINQITNKISTIIKINKTTTQKELITKLNKTIRGWCNYHQPVCAKRTFARLNNTIYNMLWKWAKRRHSNKSKKWITSKYWKKKGNRNWNFESEGKTLYNPSDTPIVRTSFPKLLKNIFIDKEYFLERQNKQKKKRQISYIKTTAAQLKLSY